MSTKVVLCDIEGTTTSISFAKDVLFPISYERMESFIRGNWNTDLVRSEIRAVQSELAAQKKISPDEIGIAEVIRILKSWIEQDKKEGPLKSIQGKIWKECFESGQIQGHVYPDVPEAFAKWTSLGVRIAIFSSGSVEAQRLIFRYSDAGDLTSFISACFDTTTGPKKEAASYQKIAAKLGVPPSEVLFLSDAAAELDAARAAGMQTIQLLRDGAPTESSHPTASTFAEIHIA